MHERDDHTEMRGRLRKNLSTKGHAPCWQKVSDELGWPYVNDMLLAGDVHAQAELPNAELPQWFH